MKPHPRDYRSASRRSLQAALVIISIFMFVELAGGFAAHSLALIADAGHMLTDAASVGLALGALWIAGRPASPRLTFGFQRTEILVALGNALALWLIAGWIAVEGYHRIGSMQQVHGLVTLIVGGIGLVVNTSASFVLKRSSGESLSVEGAFLHVFTDMLGSIGVVTAGAMILALGWNIADLIVGFVIAVLMVASSTRLLWKVLRILMEGTPPDVDIQKLCQRLERVDGVRGVHDIHAWSLTSGYNVFGAHVSIDPSSVAEREHLLQHLRAIVREELGKAHITIQLEESELGCEEAHHVAHTKAG